MTMHDVVAALLPVFLIIVVGWGTKARGIITPAQWDGFEKVTYYILFPAVIIETLVRSDLHSVPFGAMGASLIGAILMMSALLIAFRKPVQVWLAMSGPSFTSLFQGATRWNTFVALSMTASLFGKAGTTLCAVAIAAMIPLLNVLALLVLSRYAAPAKLSPRAFVITLVKNPFIWSCAIGIGINLTGWKPVGPIMTTAEMIGRASLAGGLLCVGAGLEIGKIAKPHLSVYASAVLKLALMPLMAILLGKAFGLDATALAVVAICSAVPTASGGYVLARQMGGDAPLMAEMITVQTLIAMISMPVVLALAI
jgi:malonate transporter